MMLKPTIAQLRQRADTAKARRNRHKEEHQALRDDVAGLEVKLTKFAELRPNSTVHRSEPAKAYTALEPDLRIIRELMMGSVKDLATIPGTFNIYI
jgi:chromosome segregation ATPase